MDKELLTQYGIDYEKGLANCIGNQSFYKKILGMVLDDTSFFRAEKAYENKNQAELFVCMHELKGISGNAALTVLYNATIPLVELVRHKNASFEDIDKLFSEVKQAYMTAREGIRNYLKAN